MIPPPDPNELPALKRYYTISEIADMFQVNKSLIRYWEQEFPFFKPHKGSKGERKYTQSNIEQLRLIYDLVKEKGYTLEGARKEIKAQMKHYAEKKQHIANLEALKKFIQGLM
jgi:DNA-binding transcriptional MerR regulator